MFLSAEPCNTCDNSYYGLSLEEKILKVVDDTEIEVTPCNVASRLHANHSSVRVLLRRLLEKGRVLQPYPGAYCSERIHGVRFVPLRVHNVVFTLEGLVVGEHWEWGEVVGLCDLRVVFGTERGKVTCRVSCDVGLDRSACLFAVKRCLEVVEGRLGCKVENVWLKTFEANKDYAGYRLDGVSCLTVTGLYDVIERVYQKEDNLVRHEVKVSKNTSLEDFLHLIQGGVSQYNIVQSNFALIQKLEQLAQTLKSQNGNIMMLTDVTKAMYERQVRKDSREGEGKK